jgi:hypothetical protein
MHMKHAGQLIRLLALFSLGGSAVGAGAGRPEAVVTNY